MVRAVFYKEFLELKSDKGAIRKLVLQSMGMGLLFPALMYLRLVDILPMPIGILDLGITEAERIAMIEQVLETVGLLFLPFLVSAVAAPLSMPSIAQEAQSRTLERLLSLPLSWRSIFFGKLLFCFTVSLASACIILGAYLLLSSAVLEAFQPPALLPYVFVLIPAVVFYSVSTGLFVSARATSLRTANVSGALLTWALLLGAFIVAQAMGVELGRDFMLTVGLVLFAIGLTLAYFTARVNPEKLLYGHGA